MPRFVPVASIDRGLFGVVVEQAVWQVRWRSRSNGRSPPSAGPMRAPPMAINRSKCQLDHFIFARNGAQS